MTQGRISRDVDGCLDLIFSFFRLFWKRDSNIALPYRKRESILTPAEQRFYAALLYVLENKAVVIPKVGLQDIFLITDQKNYHRARNRIVQRHLDFLICEEKTLHPLVGIELDDKSHSQMAVQRRDEFKNKVFEAGGLPLLRFPVRASFQAEEIKAALLAHIPPLTSEAIAPTCPKCNIPMVKRVAKQGEFKGKAFYACPNYPACRELINIEN
jgi:very-short-patch-repair endonuclease